MLLPLHHMIKDCALVVLLTKISDSVHVQNPLATVVDVRSKNKSKWRPVALDTVVSNNNSIPL